MEVAFLFCCDYFDKTQPDIGYREEYDAVKKQGYDAYLFSLDNFLQTKVLSINDIHGQMLLIYRGWMVTYEQYCVLYDVLLKQGLRLINSPAQYLQCHHLPQWYRYIKNYTAKSVWTEGAPDRHLILQLLLTFKNNPIVVKDYVKSRKHEWAEACFIPAATDTDKALEVINTFITRQAEDLAGGIVLREYLPLHMGGVHDKSNMPIANEVCVFCFCHIPFAAIEYWSGKNVTITAEQQDLIYQCQNLNSNFYTVDLAQKAGGQWIILEVGDGQVSGLQEYNAAVFYNGLSEVCVICP